MIIKLGLRRDSDNEIVTICVSKRSKTFTVLHTALYMFSIFSCSNFKTMSLQIKVTYLLFITNHSTRNVSNLVTIGHVGVIEFRNDLSLQARYINML